MTTQSRRERTRRIKAAKRAQVVRLLSTPSGSYWASTPGWRKAWAYLPGGIRRPLGEVI